MIDQQLKLTDFNGDSPAPEVAEGLRKNEFAHVMSCLEVETCGSPFGNCWCSPVIQVDFGVSYASFCIAIVGLPPSKRFRLV